MKKTLVSGIQSSGTLHLGNYFGAMRQNVIIGNDDAYDAYVFIANYHAMTTLKDPKALAKSSFDIACAYLACGLDPMNVSLFRQSSVVEVHELTWILNTVTSVPYLKRAHAFKDRQHKTLLEKISFTGVSAEASKQFIEDHKNVSPFQLTELILKKEESERMATKYSLSEDEIRQIAELLINVDELTQKDVNVGLFDYPVLMAADILIYGGELVPVGQDQKQHIEYARDIAGYFNREWKELFTLPKDYIAKDVAVVPGTDGEKMSKSKGNVIPLFGSDAEIKKAVMGIVTDSKTPDEKKDPDTNNVYNIHKLFLSKDEDTKLRAKYQDGGLSYKDAKEGLLHAILHFITPMREKYEHYQAHPAEVEAILEEGGRKAKAKAAETMRAVRSAVGLDA